MMLIKQRLLNIQLPPGKSAFLWGPRQTGKTYWIKQHYPDAIIIDLLKTDVLADYITRPALLRERYSDTQKLIVIDEIQLIPELLNEVHWLIENKGISFLLTGSSARKLKRKQANLLGGRAWRFAMTPLCYPEIENFDLNSVMVSGLLPSLLLSPYAQQDLRAYVANYLKEEIIAEATVQNMPAFSEFLRIAALTCGELLNYANMARDTGVNAKVIRSYFQILEDTLLGFRLQPWRKVIDRRLIETEKFYLFDIGVTHYLAGRVPVPKTREFGKAFEHYIFMELKAYQTYKNPELMLYYWRTSSGLEVDFILGDMEVAIELKSSSHVHEVDTKGLLVLKNTYPAQRQYLVSFESEYRRLSNGIESLPWQLFLDKLWVGEII